MTVRTKVLGAAFAMAAAGVVTLSAGGASAVTAIYIGNLDGSVTDTPTLSGSVTLSGSFVQDFVFTVSPDTEFTFAQLNSSTTFNKGKLVFAPISGGDVELFTASDLAMTPAVGKTATTTLGAMFADQTVSIPVAGGPSFSVATPGTILGEGTYIIQVTSSDSSSTVKADIGLSVFGTAVPEPATWAVMLVGFGGIGATMRGARRKQAATA